MSNINNVKASEITESVEADMLKSIIAKNEAELAKNNTRENIPTMQEAMMSEEQVENNTNEEVIVRTDINKMTKQALKDYVGDLMGELARLVAEKKEDNQHHAMMAEDIKRLTDLVDTQAKTITELNQKLEGYTSEEKANMCKALKLRPVSPLWNNVLVNTNDEGNVFRISFPIDFYQSNSECRTFLGNLAKHAKSLGHTATHNPDHLMIALAKPKAEAI